MQSDLNVCEPTFSLRSRVLKGRDDAMMAEKWSLVRTVYFCVLYFAKKVYDKWRRGNKRSVRQESVD